MPVLCLVASWDVNILEFKVIPLSLEAGTDHPSILTLGELPLAGTAQAEWVDQHFWIKLWLSPLLDPLSCLLCDWGELASSCPTPHFPSTGTAGLQPVLLMSPSQLGPGCWLPSNPCKKKTFIPPNLN